MTHKKQYILGATLLIVLTGATLSQPTTHSQDQVVCPDPIKAQVQDIKSEFYTDLSKLISDSTASTQNLSLVFESYRSYLSRLSQVFQDSAPNVPDSNNILTTPESTKCQQYIQSEKSLVQTTMENLLQASIRGKQSFNLIEKYSQINTQFSDLKTETDQVTKKIKTFSQQLPCYSSACVKN